MGTSGLQSWILDNIIPLIILAAGSVVLLVAFRGDNARIMKMVGGILIGLAVVGLAISGQAQAIGTILWNLLK